MTAGFVMLIRDRGHGRVTIDADGNAVHSYASPTSWTSASSATGCASCARMHEAAGARGDLTFHRKRMHCGSAARTDRGLRPARARRAADRRTSTRRSRCTTWARRAWATTPTTSVADPWGQLHDTPGVWIGDALGVPDGQRHEPDAHDDGPGAPDRRGDLGRQITSGHALLQARRPSPGLHGVRRGAPDHGPAPRPAVLAADARPAGPRAGRARKPRRHPRPARPRQVRPPARHARVRDGAVRPPDDRPAGPPRPRGRRHRRHVAGRQCHA